MVTASSASVAAAIGATDIVMLERVKVGGFYRWYTWVQRVDVDLNDDRVGGNAVGPSRRAGSQ